jgi:uncharacterized protein (TIGR03083 family)
MTPVRRFVSWVQPTASQLDADRRELIEFARAAPPGFWARPSGVEGWTCHDILAHVSGGNDQLLQVALRAAISRKPLGPEPFDVDTDAENARGVEMRRTWTAGQLIAELEEGGNELLDLLSQLIDEHRDLRGGSPMTLGEFLAVVRAERHDHEHLEQLRVVTKEAMK